MWYSVDVIVLSYIVVPSGGYFTQLTVRNPACVGRNVRVVTVRERAVMRGREAIRKRPRLERVWRGRERTKEERDLISERKG